MKQRRRVWPSIKLKKSKIWTAAATESKIISWNRLAQNCVLWNNIQTSIMTQCPPITTKTHQWKCDANKASANTRAPTVNKRHKKINTSCGHLIFALSSSDSLSARWYAANAHDIEPNDVTQDIIWPRVLTPTKTNYNHPFIDYKPRKLHENK